MDKNHDEIKPILCSDQIIVEQIDTECQQNVTQYLTDKHKQIFLRFIRADKNFINQIESHPEYMTVLTADLNKLEFTRSTADWIEIMKAWINAVKEDYQYFLRSSETNISLAAEDEDLIQQLQEDKLWSEPSIEQINCVLQHLHTEPHSPNLWPTIALELEYIGGMKRTDIFWKRAFGRIEKRLKAKKELREHIASNYPHLKFPNANLHILSNAEYQLLNALESQHARTINNSNTNATKSVFEDLTSHCRICLASTSSKMSHLFESHATNGSDTISFLDKLNYCSCLSLTAQIDDGLPQYICMSCSVLLESAYQLKMLCSKTEIKLQQLLDQIESKSDNKKTSQLTEILVDEHDDEEYQMTEEYLIDVDEPRNLEETNTKVVRIVEIRKLDSIDDVIDTSCDENKCQGRSSNTDVDVDVKKLTVAEMASNKRRSARIKSEMMESAEKYECKSCGTVHKNMSALTAHMKVSCARRKLHKCNYCDKTFKVRHSLTVHMRSHTDERPYVCETCGKAFRTVSAVNNHRATHLEVKGFKCALCPYSASTKANLRIHDRTHTKVKPFQCNFCPMRFSTASNKQKHNRNIHQKLKTNKCDQCDRSFFSRESARKHMMVTHTGLKPYTCPQCPMSYGWYNGLKKHMKAQHANMKVPTEKSYYDRLQKSLQ